jgi:FkbM family methyltransferase
MREIELNCYNAFINDSSIVYDIGAHIGETSLIFARNKAKRIYAFEPSPFNFIKLKKNTEHLNNISIFDVAFFDKKYTCRTRFRDCSTESSQDREQEIKYVLIEDFISENKIAAPDFIKIDIEGMESILLNTFKDLFEKIRPIVYVEIHANPKDLTVQNYDDCPHWKWPEDGGFDFNTLRNLNYSIFREGVGLIPTSENWNPNPGDHTGYILFPNEKNDHKKNE